MRLYHVTTPERAKMILKEGFNENKNPNYHTPFCSNGHRVYLCRKRYIPKWVRILSKEQGWKRIAILIIQIPKTWYQKLKMLAFTSNSKKPYIWDWGDQLAFDTMKSLKEGMFGIRIKLEVGESYV